MKTPTPKSRRSKQRMVRARTKLKDLVEAAHAAGVTVNMVLDPKPKMPSRFPDDPEPVRLLIEESERMSKLGNKWMVAEIPNRMAAELCVQNGWAYSLAAAWLRAKLKGELKPESKAP